MKKAKEVKYGIEIKVMNREELKQEIYELENEIRYTQSWESGFKDIKSKINKLKRSLIKLTPELIPGGTIEISDFIIRLNSSSKTDSPKIKFQNGNEYHFTSKQFEILDEMIRDEYGVYKHFNNKYDPSDITKTELYCVKQETKSNNIYDVMCAPQVTSYRYEFKVKMNYGEDPITVFKEFEKNTTLSQSEVRNFM